MSTSKTTERFSLFGDERKELTEAEEAYRLHSTAMNPDYRLQPVVGKDKTTTYTHRGRCTIEMPRPTNIAPLFMLRDRILSKSK